MLWKNYVKILLVLLLSYVCYHAWNLTQPPDLPPIDDTLWWGEGGRPHQEDTSIRQFKIPFSEEDALDLKWRLKKFRHKAPIMNGTANTYGVNYEFLREVLDYWINDYNWTERELYINKYPHFLTNIQGLEVHFVHIKPDPESNKKTYPILMLHGYPGSVLDFYEAIDTIQQQQHCCRSFNLEIVVASLPGFGFSEATSKPGLSLTYAAVIFKKLMNRLGHDQFYVQGGDFGSLTLQQLCILYPKSVLGFHTNFPVVYTVKGYLKPILSAFFPSLVVKPEHRDRVYPLKRWAWFLFRESAYFHLQATKPDSIGVAMEDSPAGLAAYVLEKLITGCNFTYVDAFDREEFLKKYDYLKILDTIMLYWIPGCATTVFRSYYETFKQLHWSESFTLFRIPVQVPTIIYRSQHDLYSADGLLPEIYPKLLNITDYNSGHLPALENGEMFAHDVLAAIELFLQTNTPII